MLLLEISKEDYEVALSISEDSHYQLFLKRPPNSCFVNNYFTDGLIAWEANVDIQPAFNHSKAVAYICAYISNSGDECSQTMRQELKEAFEDKLDNYKQMKSVGQTCVNKRERIMQEYVYRVLSGKWLRKTFPGVIFANSNILEKRYWIFREEKDISQLPEDSREISKIIWLIGILIDQIYHFLVVNIQSWILFVLLDIYDTIIRHLQNQKIMITSQKSL